jgi:putative endonuclease
VIHGFLARLRGRLCPRAARGINPWRLGERAAERHLRRRGYRLLGRNVRVPLGEADLVFESPDRSSVVIVEVKARVVGPGEPGGLPERALTRAKARKLATLARDLARRHGWTDRPVRIDLVAVEFEPGRREPRAIRHHERVVDADGTRI